MKKSIRKELINIMSTDGKYFIPDEQVIDLKATQENEDGELIKGIEISVPSATQAALLISKWMTSTDAGTSLKAIQIGLDQVDGKPATTIKIDEPVTLPDLNIIVRKQPKTLVNGKNLNQ